MYSSAYISYCPDVEKVTEVLLNSIHGEQKKNKMRRVCGPSLSNVYFIDYWSLSLSALRTPYK